MVTATETNGQQELVDEIGDEFRKRSILDESRAGQPAADVENSPAYPDGSPEKPIETDAQWIEHIESLEREVGEAESELNDLKHQCKEAKEYYEGRVDKLRRAIRARWMDANRPLLNGLDEPKAVEPEPWRAVSIDDLSLGAGATKALTAAGYTTIGSLADYTAQGLDNFTGITGIGPKASEKIVEHLQQWWQQHPDMAPATESQAETNGEATE